MFSLSLPTMPFALIARLAVVLLFTVPAFGTAEAQPRKRGAAATPEEPPGPNHVAEGDRALSEGRLADAVRAFMRADDEERSLAYLGKAFDAAVQLDDPLLMVQVAERILSRSELSDEGRTRARKAVARASDHLTQLELVCGERHCQFEVDGEVVAEGISWWLPGAHEVRLAARPETARRVTCAARAICRLTLPSNEPVPSAVPVVAAVPAASPAATPRAAPPAAAAVSEPAPERLASRPEEDASSAEPTPAQDHVATNRSRLPLSVLVVTSVGAAALGSLAIWSGVQAIHARDLHSSDPAAYDEDDVRRHARRSDYFTLGAVLSAGAAVATAIWWVDWDARRSTRVAFGGSGFTATHRF